MEIRREHLKIDPAKCTACYDCSTACAVKHHGQADIGFSRIRILQFNDRKFNVPVICMACEEPICISVCPMNARKKEANGTIVTDPGVCIGCKACLYICPVGGPVENPSTGQTMTCDMCKGDPQGPRCVIACGDRGAITICNIDVQADQAARKQAGRMRRIFA